MKNTQRKLTEKEKSRLEEFEKKEAELLGQGYERKDLTFDIVTANILGILIPLPILVLFVFLFLQRQKPGTIFSSTFSGMIAPFLFFLVVILLIVLHELIHGLVWSVFSENHFRDIEFGVIWSMLTPYCSCKAPLKKGQYIIGGIMPTVVLGIVPAGIACLTGNGAILLYALIMIIGGGGDLLLIRNLFKFREKGRECIYMDHPSEMGCVIYMR